MKLNRLPFVFLAIAALFGAVAAQGDRVSPHETTELTLNSKKLPSLTDVLH